MMTFKEIEKYHNEMSKIKITCKCGHRIIISPKHDYCICDWCGNYVFRDKKTEFKQKLKRELMRSKNK